jgi:high-affinity Fe2+/Pb2+ permease
MDAYVYIICTQDFNNKWNNYARNQHETGSNIWSGESQGSIWNTAFCLIYGGFLSGLSFDRKDGGDMLLRKVGWLSTD